MRIKLDCSMNGFHSCHFSWTQSTLRRYLRRKSTNKQKRSSIVLAFNLFYTLKFCLKYLVHEYMFALFILRHTIRTACKRLNKHFFSITD